MKSILDFPRARLEARPITIVTAYDVLMARAVARSNADAILVTGDSVNMVGEALAAGRPVHVYEPRGGHRKITAYIDALVSQGLARRWQGRLESALDVLVDGAAALRIAADALFPAMARRGGLGRLRRC